jgi:large subunit ribosomal protein L28
MVKQCKKAKGGTVMSRVCAISGRGALSGNRRSHSLRATRRKWNVNLQKVKIMVDGKPVRVKISTRELKKLKAQAA